MGRRRKVKKSKPLFYRILRPVFTAIFHFYFHPTYVNISRIPKTGAVVLAGNHKNALDPIFVDSCTKRVVHTLAKKDLHDGAFGWFFRAAGTIPVDLHADHNHDALEAAVDYLNAGDAINVSPEAKRNYTKEILLPFKPGAVVMAQRSHCPVVPYCIVGDYRFQSKNLTIVFGKPVSVEGLSVEEANDKLFKTIKELLIINAGRKRK